METTKSFKTHKNIFRDLINEEQDFSKQHLLHLLQDSIFYPACGTDGSIVKLLSHKCSSFIYCDYNISKDALSDSIINEPFTGYSMAKRIELKSEFIPNDMSLDIEHNYSGIRRVAPYGELCIFQRNKGVEFDHGPDHFGMLFFAVEGVLAYRELFHAQKILPYAIAVIQPGTGFGNNWTDFCGNDQALAKVVRQHPNGLPRYMLQGGIGGPYFYCKPYWKEFDGPLNDEPLLRNIHVFENTVYSSC